MSDVLLTIPGWVFIVLVSLWLIGVVLELWVIILKLKLRKIQKEQEA